ncbi:MAG: molybdopterin-guanine dinucleotide biosynthesis protein MobB [Desulfurococcaceae archaeon]
MPQPYVLRIVSLESGVGKTLVATRVVRGLRTRNYRVNVIKHCSGGVDLEEKGTEKYLESGAEVVVASSPGLAVIYVANHNDAIENALVMTRAPIVVVEGFKSAKLGDVVVVVREEDDLNRLGGDMTNVIAIVSRASIVAMSRLPENTVLVKVGDEDRLVDLVEKRAIDFFYRQTPQTNCRTCGFASCKELVISYLKGSAGWCPVVSGVEVSVDGSSVPLNPFVKNIIKSTIKGILKALKGVPENYRKVNIVISDY